MIINPVYVFGSLVVLIETTLNTDLQNAKLFFKGLNHLGVQITILPVETLEHGRNFIKGRGGITKAQERACSTLCEFRAKALGSKFGGCYAYSGLPDKFEKARDLYEMGESNPLLLAQYQWSTDQEYTLRCSTWGDLGRLNNEGQEFVKHLLDNATNRLAYVSQIDKLDPSFKGQVLASVQDEEGLKRALSLGYKMYLGTQEAVNQARSRGIKFFKCPYTRKNLERLKGNKLMFSVKHGCYACPIKCNGENNVASANLI